MQNLTRGIKKPENSDSGSEWFPAVATNFSRLSEAVNVTAQTALAASWVATSGGTYRQLVTIPTSLTNSPHSLTFDTLALEVRLSDGSVIHPTIEKVSSTTFYIYINDNTLSLTVLYHT